MKLSGLTGIGNPCPRVLAHARNPTRDTKKTNKKNSAAKTAPHCIVVSNANFVAILFGKEEKMKKISLPQLRFKAAKQS